VCQLAGSGGDADSGSGAVAAPCRFQTTLDVYVDLMPDQLHGTVERLDRHNLVIGQNPDKKKTALSR